MNEGRAKGPGLVNRSADGAALVDARTGGQRLVRVVAPSLIKCRDLSISDSYWVHTSHTPRKMIWASSTCTPVMSGSRHGLVPMTHGTSITRPQRRQTKW